MGLRSQRRPGRRRGGAAAQAPPRLRAAVGRFTLGSLVAIGVIVLGGFLALRGVALSEAENGTRDRVRADGQLVEAAGLRDGILHSRPRALRQLDQLVLARILGGPIVRVKLWSQSGTILYSDEPALIGRRYVLGADERRLFSTGGTDAAVSNLSKPENRYERPQGKLLEAYTTIRTPGGTQVLFEIYERFSSVDAGATRLLGTIAPPLVVGVVLLGFFQLPLAWSMARRLQRGHAEREALLESAVAASAQERRRIAADLHDGVVQDIAGVAFGLAPLTAEADRRGDEIDAGILRGATETLRQGVRDLRTLLVEIHPPNLDSAGLRVALSDLLSPIAAAGTETSLDLSADRSANDPLIYRVAREAIRNAQQHADATSIRVSLSAAAPDRMRLVVADDGRGFAPGARERSSAEGHLGLTLLEGIVAQAGGRLVVSSTPGVGTTVTMDVPER
jgi:two-component system, NarL family, sensor kinase